MQSSFSARLVLEMLDRIGDVDTSPVDPCFRKRLAEYAPGGADERMPDNIFFVTRLLTDQHHCCGRPALSEHCLRSVSP